MLFVQVAKISPSRWKMEEDIAYQGSISTPEGPTIPAEIITFINKTRKGPVKC